jgi:hypothetical protein
LSLLFAVASNQKDTPSKIRKFAVNLYGYISKKTSTWFDRITEVVNKPMTDKIFFFVIEIRLLLQLGHMRMTRGWNFKKLERWQFIIHFITNGKTIKCIKTNQKNKLFKPGFELVSSNYLKIFIKIACRLLTVLIKPISNEFSKRYVSFT